MTIALMVAIVVAAARPAEHPVVPRLLAAIRQVESAGNDRAVGDAGRSLGPYQITLAYWLDAGRSSATYHRDVWSPAISALTVRAYWRRYCPSTLAAGNWRVLAAVHNAGPGAGRRAQSPEYVRRIRRAMRGQHRWVTH